MSDTKSPAEAPVYENEVGIRRINEFFVRLCMRYLPDPYLFVIILTILTFLLAFFLTERAATELVVDWYSGVFELLEYTVQALLVAVTGFALAQAPVVSGVLDRLASIPKTQAQAGVVVMLTTAVASLLSWGLGLVVAGIMARQIAKQMPVNYGYIVAAAYGGFMVWASGISSTIALVSATPGNTMNVIEDGTGEVTSMAETLFTWWNVVPVVLLLLALSSYYYHVAPKGGFLTEEQRQKLKEEDKVEEGKTEDTPARKLEESSVLTILLLLLPVVYFAVTISQGTFTLGLNELIMIFFILGWLAHRNPIRYVRAFQNSIRAGGPIALQFPLYGGLMGIMVASGLSEVLARGFVAFSSQSTLPFWSFISSIIISIFVPSGGGHWVVQGPIMVPAASELGADQALTAMGVAYGEQVANMIQPFWALPILAIVGLGIRQVMGYGVLAFFIGTTIFGGTLLIAGFVG